MNSKSKSTQSRCGKAGAKPDHYPPEVLREILARNPWMFCVEGVSFAEGEQVNYDPATGLVVKSGAPGSVPLGETCLTAPAEKGRNVVVPVFTCDEFHRKFTLKEKEEGQS